MCGTRPRPRGRRRLCLDVLRTLQPPLVGQNLGTLPGGPKSRGRPRSTWRRKPASRHSCRGCSPQASLWLRRGPRQRRRRTGFGRDYTGLLRRSHSPLAAKLAGARHAPTRRGPKIMVLVPSVTPHMCELLTYLIVAHPNRQIKVGFQIGLSRIVSRCDRSWTWLRSGCRFW